MGVRQERVEEPCSPGRGRSESKGGCPPSPPSDRGCGRCRLQLQPYVICCTRSRGSSFHHGSSFHRGHAAGSNMQLPPCAPPKLGPQPDSGTCWGGVALAVPGDSVSRVGEWGGCSQGSGAGGRALLARLHPPP